MDHSKEGKRNQKLTDLKRCCFVVVCSFVLFGRGGVGQGRWGGGGREQKQTRGNESHWDGSHYWRHCSYYLLPEAILSTS